ncbi:MAG: hypothetical protein A4E64_02832 [Syntrophorhabdus sp. PtaU1.Bin058]|nr:MAG: hypothetical protein A4E64_02832 [Syntrophorhabdus sp. PtaU1.Bin058]
MVVHDKDLPVCIDGPFKPFFVDAVQPGHIDDPYRYPFCLEHPGRRDCFMDHDRAVCKEQRVAAFMYCDPRAAGRRVIIGQGNGSGGREDGEPEETVLFRLKDAPVKEPFCLQGVAGFDGNAVRQGAEERYVADALVRDPGTCRKQACVVADVDYLRALSGVVEYLLVGP